MEISKNTKHEEFVWRDVAFKVRTSATVGDRYEVDMLYEVDAKGVVKVPRREMYLTLIERFVDGWRGVTEEGRAVPFSLPALLTLPSCGNEDPVLLLGAFVLNRCGLFPTTEDAARKKD